MALDVRGCPRAGRNRAAHRVELTFPSPGFGQPRWPATTSWVSGGMRCYEATGQPLQPISGVPRGWARLPRRWALSVGLAPLRMPPSGAAAACRRPTGPPGRVLGSPARTGLQRREEKGERRWGVCRSPVPNRLTRVPDSLPPPLNSASWMVRIADCGMRLFVSTPESGSLRTTWVTPATLWTSSLVVGGCVLLALLCDLQYTAVLTPLGAVGINLLCAALATICGAITCVGMLQRLRAGKSHQFR